MTALDKFIRLEAIGYWRPRPGAELQEVIVSFGNSTLQLTSLDDTPLTHWALRAVKRIGTDGSDIIYSADSSGDEILVIADAEMISAIATVTFEIGQMRPPKRHLKKILWLGAVLLALAALSQSGPMIYGWAAKLTSPARLSAFAENIGSKMDQLSPPICRDYRSVAALTSFSAALGLDNPPELIIAQQNGPTSHGLPNGKIYLAYQMIAQSPDAETLAARIVVEYMMVERHALLLHVLASAGPIASIGHMFGRDIHPSLPMSFPAPLAIDYIAARDHFYAMGIATGPLQEMAAEHGFGLPVNGSAIVAPFAPQIFARIQTYCAP